ncbi:MAG: hypothetical protein HWE21_10325 [Cytophagia bacterium]|nr:hypothetical protein [Cytophagia bacterium]
MKSFTRLLVLALILSSCNPVKDKKVDQTTISFKTDESSKLFFKNVRRSYYDVEVMDEAKLEIYRLEKRVKESDKPILNISIVNNWRYDEAYILLEPNSAAGPLTELQILWENENGSSGEILLEGGNKKNQLDFAAKVYEQIQIGSQFYLRQNNQKIQLLDDSKSREAFRVTMFDYFRLTLAY